MLPAGDQDEVELVISHPGHQYKALTMLPAGYQDEVEPVPPHPGHQQAASSVLYTTSCKHSLVLLRVGEIIARNMLS